MPCRGISFTDKDDAAANRNIRAGWFAFSGGRLTANLRVQQVDQKLETGGGSATFAMYYSVHQHPRYASARTDGRTWTFEYGDDGGGSAGPAQTTTGAVQGGPNGVIEIEIPSEHAREHDTVRGIHARSFTRDAGGVTAVTGSQTDGAPDSNDPGKFGYGANFLVESCPAGSPEPPPPPTDPPPPGPSPDPPAGPPPGSTVTPPGGPFKVTVPRLRARSLARGRSFRVGVDPSEPLKAVVITLRRNGRVVARGRRASVSRASAVSVRVRRRVARGTHRLTVSGRTPDGGRATRAITVRVG